MASTYSSNLKLELIADGEKAGLWGQITNLNLGTAIEEAIVGIATVSFGSDADLTIDLTASNTSQAARNAALNVVSGVALTATRNLIVPAIRKPYVVANLTTGGQAIIVKTAAGTGVTIPNGQTTWLYVDGTNVIQSFTYLPTLRAGDLTVQGIGDFTATSYLSIPSGTTAQRGTPTRPSIRYNATLTSFEGFNGATWGSIGGAGAISGDKNRVINGSCQIVNQATFVASNNTAGYGGPEMFYAQNDNAGGQFTQSQGSLTFGGITLPTVRQTVNTPNTNITAGNYWFGILQLLEGFNVFDLRGKPVTVSFVFNTNLTGVYSVSLRDAGDATRSYVTTINATANVPLQVSIPISNIPLDANVLNSNTVGLQLSVGFLNTGTFQTGTLNAWQSGNFVSATGATNWGTAAGNFIELTNLQLEEGTVASPFVRRSYSQELDLTQRYFEKSYNLATQPAATTMIGISSGGNNVGGTLLNYTYFKTPKRIAPTIQLYDSNSNGPGAIITISSGGVPTTRTTPANIIGENGFNISFVTTDVLAQYHWLANARL